LRIFIPQIGQKLRLTSEFAFTVEPYHYNYAIYNTALPPTANEHRNAIYSDIHNGLIMVTDTPNYRVLPPLRVVLPPGLVLKVLSVKVLRPHRGRRYDKVCFQIMKRGCALPDLAGLRFQVAVDEVNRMETELV